MGFVQQNEEEAIIWRGPMVHNEINQLLQNTEWGEPQLPGNRSACRHLRRFAAR